MTMLRSTQGLVESNSESDNSFQEPTEHAVVNVSKHNEQLQLERLLLLKNLRSDFQH